VARSLVCTSVRRMLVRWTRFSTRSTCCVTVRRHLDEKKTRAENTGTDADRSEYYLGIEGFLLHLRNLLAFLTNRRNESTDLGINAPDRWAGREVEQREYSDLIKNAKEIDAKYGRNDSNCYDQISKFLQHCTTYRHQEPRDWDIEGISTDIEPVLSDFEKRFLTIPAKKEPEIRFYSGASSYSTTTMRTSVILPGLPKK